MKISEKSLELNVEADRLNLRGVSYSSALLIRNVPARRS